MIKDIFRLMILPAYRPVYGIQELISHPHKIAVSSLIFLFLGIIYTFSVQIALMKGFGASVEPFIKISADNYYFWQRFYQIPFFFLTSILFAGICRLLSSAFSGKGTFEDIYCLFAVAQTFPMFVTMWIPETICFIAFSETGIIPVWIDIPRQVIGVLWPLFIVIIGLSMIEKINRFISTLIVLTASVPVTLMMIIFIR